MSSPAPCVQHQSCPSPSPSESASQGSLPPSVTITTLSSYTYNTEGSYSPSPYPATAQSGSSETIVTYTPPTSPSPSSSPTSSVTPVVDAATSSPNVGAIAGAVIGGVIFLVCIALGILLYLRARKRKRIAPSSEFMNSLRAGAAPVLRLDSGAEYTPALPEKGGCSHYSSSTPLPFMQNSYYTSPAMETMKFPDTMMMSDIASSRPSVEKPLRPQWFSDHPIHDPYADKDHHVSTSIGSRRELWCSDGDIVPSDLPARQSLGQGRDALAFAPRYSIDEPPSQPFSATPRDCALHEVAGEQSPPRVLSPSLQPLRRQEST